MSIKLDYTIEDPQGRKSLVEEILAEEHDPSPRYLEILADYLVSCMDKQEKKERCILTENRLATITKRETSFEELVSKLENGEDGIYNLICDDKNTIFRPKVSITKKDLEEIQPLRQLREAIDIWEAKSKTVSGKEAFIMKKALIEMRKDQYIIKNAYRKPIVPNKLTRTPSVIALDSEESIIINQEGATETYSSGLTFLNPNICSEILCNYSKLKASGAEDFLKDTWFMMDDFDNLCTTSLREYPLYERLVECKVDGMQNVDIQQALEEEFGIKHSIEYISSLWRNKIPKMIAATALDEWLIWYYTIKERGKWKKCSRCKEIKLAHNRFFSLNKTSKDGFYSICKECRNAKK